MTTEFAIAITNARKESGKTQTEAAQGVGVTLRQWQRYEAGLMPGYKKLKEIEDFLKCDLSAVWRIKKVPDKEDLAFIDIYAMLRVTLSMLATQEAARTGEMIGSVVAKMERFVEAERQAKLKSREASS